MKNKRGQVTIFIIIAIIIVAAVVLFLLLREKKTEISEISVDLQPPYTAFLGCLNDYTKIGIRILEMQGGYIELPEFEPGSSYMPFSNYLDFLGTNVPYWYYVTGNNIAKSQVPAKAEMEDQLARFIEEKINDCNLKSFYEAGYSINISKSNAEVDIKEDRVDVILNSNLYLSRLGESQEIKIHSVSVNSHLGKLYSSALNIYDKEQNDLFLEEYGIDVLNLYAPVNGVELTCSPLVWDAQKVFEEISVAIEANTQALKTKGGSDDYFYLDLGVEENVRFLNSKNWTSAYEVNPSEGQLLVSMPIGNQPGLGLLGFCYVPYHYVYNVRYPVLVQVYKDDEIFQFPMAVVILGNKAREPTEASSVEGQIIDFCRYKNTDVRVEVFDSSGRSIDADISYDCSGTTCYIGKTINGELYSKFPQCVNGRVIARADGFVETSKIVSTLKALTVEISMDKIYELDVDLLVDSRSYSGEAVVSFSSNTTIETILYPEQKTIRLSPDEYVVVVYVYDEANLDLGSSITEQCVEVPKGGIGGLIGLTEEKCFDIEMPESVVSKALSAGGRAQIYLLDSTLKGATSVRINAEGLPKPDTLEQLQNNYILFEDKFLDIDFR